MKASDIQVVTLWYRAPEILLGSRFYSPAMDMWSVGCIFAELAMRNPLFNVKDELTLIDEIFRIMGTPNESIWPGISDNKMFKGFHNRFSLCENKFRVFHGNAHPEIVIADFK